MARRDTIDFVSAFAVGAILGVAAALLLRPEPPSRTQRILKQLGPYGKQVRSGARQARRGLEERASAAGDLGAELNTAARELLRGFRSEVADILSAARDDLARTLNQQVEEAQTSLRRTARKLRRS
ncbi:MAG: hypothetical protein HY703_11985 [Gemmatimonadetes bacterium]|nr:hypothetical protein [Gemmatimonadota bacterium]